MSQGTHLDVVYLHYGAQSGVTQHVVAELVARGHRLTPVSVPGPLEFRTAAGRRRLSLKGALHLALSAARFGPRQALAHRWNTTYAFDVHSRRAGKLLKGVRDTPQLVLQNGALFSPGLPPPQRYTLLLDHTRALSMARGDPVIDYGSGWREREIAVYRGARSIATFSRRVAESLQRDYGVPKHRIHVVGAGANVFPEKVEHRDDGQTILFVGKDFERKGGPILLRAFERLRHQRPAMKLVIAGPREVPRLPAGAINRGFIPAEELVALFAQATLFAMPTLREPFGLAFLDAMACGLPCIGTAIEAVPEVIEHDVTGLLVPPGDADALADALLRLLDNPDRRREMGRHGRRRVEASFRWSHVGERLERALAAGSVNLD
jgi:glycosyltransferase involved in cell wall biosynthesis